MGSKPSMLKEESVKNTLKWHRPLSIDAIDFCYVKTSIFSYHITRKRINGIGQVKNS